MSNVKTQAITNLRDNIYDEVSRPGVTSFTRSGRFAGVFISLGNVDSRRAKHLHKVIKHNPQYGIQLLIQRVTVNN
ncbi:hypothetical protein NC796_02490 [Aliifodinibius sp. S!AR15-10]|uniref:hypothetical protein n=1 Tax=Aliifodinibius sp. S!AR15-10 TaxID=2950437 RepID=UPI00285D08AB|nr:hypothetical protein [Aliifodinibius sp. S!AR15-10]MDR8389990.1 hypothetical protein [Aliifodinibius sp. S!AR15-10]